MDSRAKQRLTGAIILVALFVLLVPELLRGPRNAGTPDTAAEEGMRRYTIDLNAANPTTPPPDSLAAPPVALPQPAPAREEALAKPGDSAEPAAASPAAATPVATPPSASTTPPVAQAPQQVQTPQPAPAPAPAPRVEASSPARATPVAPGSFVVQLGSFGSRDNADRLVRDMTAKGFAAFVAPIKSGGRELYRVRVGPTRDRAQAEALAAQLRRVGQSGAIVPIS
jgi:cell division septation protein DedD